MNPKGKKRGWLFPPYVDWVWPSMEPTSVGVLLYKCGIADALVRCRMWVANCTATRCALFRFISVAIPDVNVFQIRVYYTWKIKLFFACVGFEVLIAVIMKNTVLWDITPCSPLKVNWRFGGTCHLHLQGRRITRARNQRDSRWEAELFDPEDGGDMFLWNVGWLSADYMAFYPRR
jgi:hypothetical protein